MKQTKQFLSPHDTVNERALKIEGIRLYNKSIEERRKRKKYVVDANYGVNWGLNERFTRRPRHKEIFNNYSKFARFATSKQQFRELIDGLIHEDKLREKIKKLRHYMINGVTSVQQFMDIEQYYKEQRSGSLDEIARYLKRQNIINSINVKKRSMRRHSFIESTGDLKEQRTENEQRDISKMKGFDGLNDGEKKLCSKLKIAPNDLQFVQRKIGDLVQRHRLINVGDTKKQIELDIGNVADLKNSLSINIGLVNPQPRSSRNV